MALIRVSLLKERDQIHKELFCEMLAKALGTSADKAERHAISNPSTGDRQQLQRLCQEIGQAILERTGKIPSIELVAFGEDGPGQAIWRFRPTPRRPTTKAPE